MNVPWPFQQKHQLLLYNKFMAIETIQNIQTQNLDHNTRGQWSPFIIRKSACWISRCVLCPWEEFDQKGNQFRSA